MMTEAASSARKVAARIEPNLNFQMNSHQLLNWRDKASASCSAAVTTSAPKAKLTSTRCDRLLENRSRRACETRSTCLLTLIDMSSAAPSAELIAFFSSASRLRSSCTACGSGVSAGGAPSSVRRLLISPSLGRKETATPITCLAKSSSRTFSLTSSPSSSAFSVTFGPISSTCLPTAARTACGPSAVWARASPDSARNSQRQVRSFRKIDRVKNGSGNQIAPVA